MGLFSSCFHANCGAPAPAGVDEGCFPGGVTEAWTSGDLSTWRVMEGEVTAVNLNRDRATTCLSWCHRLPVAGVPPSRRLIASPVNTGRRALRGRVMNKELVEQGLPGPAPPSPISAALWDVPVGLTESCSSAPPVDLAAGRRAGVGGPQHLAVCQDGPAARLALAASDTAGPHPAGTFEGPGRGNPGRWTLGLKSSLTSLCSCFCPLSDLTTDPEVPGPSAAGLCPAAASSPHRRA